jgi:hypothetical protein
VRGNKWNSRYCHRIKIPKKKKKEKQLGKKKNEKKKKKKLVLNIAYDLPTISFFLFCWKNCRYTFCGWFSVDKCGKYTCILEIEFLPLPSIAVHEYTSSKLNKVGSI